MTGWTCPDCDTDDVVSVREWREVFDYRRAIKDDPRGLARELEGYGIHPAKSEGVDEFCQRWAAGETDGPELVCANCTTPWSRMEVPA